VVLSSCCSVRALPGGSRGAAGSGRGGGGGGGGGVLLYI